MAVENFLFYLSTCNTTSVLSQHSFLSIVLLLDLYSCSVQTTGFQFVCHKRLFNFSSDNDVAQSKIWKVLISGVRFSKHCCNQVDWILYYESKIIPSYCDQFWLKFLVKKTDFLVQSVMLCISVLCIRNCHKLQLWLSRCEKISLWKFFHGLVGTQFRFGKLLLLLEVPKFVSEIFPWFWAT